MSLSTLATSTQITQARPRLGQISYVNCLPVVLPIERGYIQLAAETLYGYPAELNQAYTQMKLDLGAMSSYYFLSQPQMELIPTVTISADGPVGSVLFFSKVDPLKLAGRCVAVPSDSATSTNLLKILLAEQLGIKIEVVPASAPTIHDERFAGALLIGDRALALDNDWSNSYWRADLGQWWHNLTGLPMIFAVWAARFNWFSGNRPAFHAIADSLKKSADHGLNELFPLIMAEARRRTNLSAERLEHYYHSQLNYDFTARHKDGLESFRKMCYRHKLLACS